MRDTLRRGVAAVLVRDAPGQYSVAEHEGRVVGSAAHHLRVERLAQRPVWWIQSVHVAETARRLGVFRALYAHVRQAAPTAGAGGLRLYVDETNTAPRRSTPPSGMNGGHYQVFEDMFDEPAKATDRGRTCHVAKCNGDRPRYNRVTAPLQTAASRPAARTTS